MIASPPSGTVTFLLTDLEGSTRMWEQDPGTMRPAMVRHDEMLEKVIRRATTATFSRAWVTAWLSHSRPRGDAICAAASRSRTPWPTRIGLSQHRLKARIGLAHGPKPSSSTTPAMPACQSIAVARLMAAAHGGQIVISGATPRCWYAISYPAVLCWSTLASISCVISGVRCKFSS